MECPEIREALSARLDHEETGVAAAAIDHHLAGCPGCTAWAARAEALHRAVRVREAEPVPDLSSAIVDAFVPVRRPGLPAGFGAEAVSGPRWALFVVALTQLVLAAPALLGDDPGASVHVARELGSFDVALAVGLLVAAWQPARAWGLLPVAAALAVVMAGTASLDLIDGRASTVGEAHHLLDLAGVVLLWIVARDTHVRSVEPAARA